MRCFDLKQTKVFSKLGRINHKLFKGLLKCRSSTRNTKNNPYASNQRQIPSYSRYLWCHELPIHKLL